MELIQNAADWSISFAAGSSEKKRAFLEDVSQGRGKDFLQGVLETYQSSSGTADTRGKCGYPIGSSEYLTHMERVVFRQDIPTMHSARWGSPDYEGLLKDALDAIASQLERDLERNERENNYVTDDTTKELKSAVSELEHCEISTGSAGSKIEKLSWFVGGDPAKIRQLQQKLNELGIGEHLTEDGVYGKKTAHNISNFFNHFLEGSIPSLNWVDPLQTEFTGILVGSSKGQWNNVLRDQSGFQYFRVDPPHSTKSGGWKNGYYRGNRRAIDYNHVNVNFPNPASKIEGKLKAKYNHYPLSDQVYHVLSNMEHSAQIVKIAGKAFLITGIVSDIMELVPTIEADLHDADRKLGSTTDHAVAKMEGRWAGSILGGNLGAKYGAIIGSAIFPGPGTAIGGFAGGLILGIAGSYGGDWFAQKVIDITEVVQ
ncbi:hypothetical protein [Oscillibacter sp.]|uniref:peptidoglycan-binding domain-containing protein n=1 Tax=Oscillibacter sp. TaxID=1945593 RepID=UPI00260F641E|nr:hypothetical protein [Oscillibacter sp.]MDD3346681.1 hypothetical protein [Oscillibacter sp.]